MHYGKKKKKKKKTHMYPAFKINKDIEWSMLETLTSKMAAQIWQNANLIK